MVIGRGPISCKYLVITFLFQFCTRSRGFSSAKSIGFPWSSSLSSTSSSSSSNDKKNNKTMKKAELWLVRHGETEANRDLILQGHFDKPLTEKGRLEAKQVGQALSKVAFKKLYSSDLPRCQTTSQILLAESETYNPEVELLVFNALLRELRFGVREGLPRAWTIEECREKVARDRGISPTEVADDIETLEQILERQRKFLVDVLYDDLPGHMEEASIPKVLVVCHGGFIKRWLKKYCDLEMTGIANCSISKVLVEYTSKEEFKCSSTMEDCDITNHITGGVEEIND